MTKFNYILLLLVLNYFGYSQISVISTDSIRIEAYDPGVGGSGGTLATGADTINKVGRKLIYWIHGLAGNEHSWNRVQAVTENQTGTQVPGYPERDVEGLALSYEGHENLDIFQLGSYVNNQIEIWRTAIPRRDTLDVKRNFIIAHSQGGIVSRAMRYKNIDDPFYNHQQFGAIATFGTPHGGAKIINSTVQNGDVQRWINEGCKATAAATIRTFVNSKWWLDLLVSPSLSASLSSIACDGMDKTVLPILVNSIRKPVGSDYAIGAPNLAKLDSMAQIDTLKVVTFYGEEQEPVFWRTVHSMTFSKDTSIAGNILSTDPFGLNEDQELVDLINNKISNYSLMENFYSDIQDNIKSHLLYSILFNVLFDDNLFEDRIDEYHDARQWLSLANVNWKRFIGARRDTSFLDGYHCDCLIDSGGTNGYVFKTYKVQTIQECNSIPARSRVIHPIIVHNIIDEPSDGVVTVKSQNAYPGALSVRMKNTNHMQQRNSLRTKECLIKLFQGRYGRKFKLDEK